MLSHDTIAACFVVALYVHAAVVYGFTAVFQPIASEFGWSYAQISLGNLERLAKIGIVAIFIGNRPLIHHRRPLGLFGHRFQHLLGS